MSILNKIIQFFTRIKKWFTGCFILKKDKGSKVNYYDDIIGSVSGEKKFNPRPYTSSAYSQQKQPDSTKDTDASLNTKKLVLIQKLDQTQMEKNLTPDHILVQHMTSKNNQIQLKIRMLV